MFEIREWKFYLAYQDGPATYDEYDTYEEANNELQKWTEFEKRGVCIMNRLKTRIQ